MTVDEMKAWIDRATYAELLRKWRFAPAGDPFFAGEVGDYYAARLSAKHAEIGNDEHVRTSKTIGWKP